MMFPSQRADAGPHGEGTLKGAVQDTEITPNEGPVEESVATGEVGTGPLGEESLKGGMQNTNMSPQDESDDNTPDITQLSDKIREALYQRPLFSRQYNKTITISLLFEGDTTNARQDIDTLNDALQRNLDITHSFKLTIQSSPQYKFRLTRDLVKCLKALYLYDGTISTALIIFHYVGHGTIEDNKLMLHNDGQRIPFQRFIRSELEDNTDEADFRVDILYILDCCYAGWGGRGGSSSSRIQLLAAGTAATNLRSASNQGGITFSQHVAAEINRLRNLPSLSVSDIYRGLLKAHKHTLPILCLLRGSDGIILHQASISTTLQVPVSEDKVDVLLLVHLRNHATDPAVEELCTSLKNMSATVEMEVVKIIPSNSTMWIIIAEVSIAEVLLCLPGSVLLGVVSNA